MTRQDLTSEFFANSCLLFGGLYKSHYDRLSDADKAVYDNAKYKEGRNIYFVSQYWMNGFPRVDSIKIQYKEVHNGVLFYCKDSGGEMPSTTRIAEKECSEINVKLELSITKLQKIYYEIKVLEVSNKLKTSHSNIVKIGEKQAILDKAHDNLSAKMKPIFKHDLSDYKPGTSFNIRIPGFPK